MKALERIKKFKPCNEAIEWLGEERTIEQMVNECDRGDWLLWLAKKADLDLRKLTLAKALCVRQIEHLLTDERSINALNVAERFGRGKAERDELDAAYDAATDAATAAYATAVAYAAWPVAAAADAADADAADADAVAAAYVAYVAYADAKSNSLKRSADICLEVFGEELIKILQK